MAVKGRFLSVAAAGAIAVFVSMSVQAAQLEQIGCIYDALPLETRLGVAQQYLAGGADPKAKATIGLKAAMKRCKAEHDWEDDATENATRYMVFRTLSEESASKMVPATVQTVDQYFNENAGALLARDDFLQSDVWPIRVDLQSKGLMGEEGERAITYLAWTVMTQQLRGDFVTGKLRGG